MHVGNVVVSKIMPRELRGKDLCRFPSTAPNSRILSPEFRGVSLIVVGTRVISRIFSRIKAVTSSVGSESQERKLGKQRSCTLERAEHLLEHLQNLVSAEFVRFADEEYFRADRCNGLIEELEPVRTYRSFISLSGAEMFPGGFLSPIHTSFGCHFLFPLYGESEQAAGFRQPLDTRKYMQMRRESGIYRSRHHGAVLFNASRFLFVPAVVIKSNTRRVQRDKRRKYITIYERHTTNWRSKQMLFQAFIQWNSIYRIDSGRSHRFSPGGGDRCKRR